MVPFSKRNGEGFIPSFGLLLLALVLTAACSSSKAREEGEGQCCTIGDQSVPGVELEKVCLKSGNSVFHFATTVPLEACVDLARTELKDESGRSYRGLSHQGLPDCSEPLRLQQPRPFTWTFEEFDDDARSLSLTENYTMELPAWRNEWSSWKWPQLDLSHCGF